MEGDTHFKRGKGPYEDLPMEVLLFLLFLFLLRSMQDLHSFVKFSRSGWVVISS
jgi:hypothetical protein